RLLDGVGGVEVALRQHEGAGRGRVGGRVAVGRRVPDEVVLVAAAGQVRAAVTVLVVDLRLVGEVAVVVGVGVGDEVVGDRVELDRVDPAGLVVERGEDLVAAGGPDDHDLLRRL